MKENVMPVFGFMLLLILSTSSAGALELSRSGDASRNATPQSARMQLAATNEKEAAELCLGKRWDAGRIAEIAERVASLPDRAAAEVLWLAASAPPGVDVRPVFENALSAVSPRVRAAALSALLGDDDPGLMGMATRALARERDAEVVRIGVEGLSSLPGKRALEGLLDAVLVPGATPGFLALACGELRRITGTHLSDDPEAWRGWRRMNDGNR